MKNQRNLEGIVKLSMLMIVRYLHFSMELSGNQCQDAGVKNPNYRTLKI